jgi:SAM-dependent methyltransferase
MPVPATPVSSPPSRGEFSEEGYLQLHPDVAAALEAGIVGSAWQHFVLHGQREGREWVRQPNPLEGACLEIAPDDEMLHGNVDHYFDVGASAMHCIEAALKTARRDPSTIRSVLDLPCGHGRVLRFLRKAFPAAQLTACDLNRSGVEFCARTFAAIPVVSHAEIDRIPLGGGFDLIWCGSLLTHLDEQRCAAFLQLFHRNLARGGLVVFTLHGRACEAELASGRNKCDLDDRLIATLLDAYRRHGFGYVDYTAQLGYGFSLARPSFVLERFIQHQSWQLIGYHEKGWDKRQDVICLRKN